MTTDQEQFVRGLAIDGEIEAAAVLEAAQPDDSPIHDLFEWDNDVCGDRYRLDQARAIIRRIRIEVVSPTPIPVYIRKPLATHKEPGYVNTQLLRTRGQEADAAVDAEISRIISAVNRGAAVAMGVDRVDRFNEGLTRALAPRVASEIAS